MSGRLCGSKSFLSVELVFWDDTRHHARQVLPLHLRQRISFRQSCSGRKCTTVLYTDSRHLGKVVCWKRVDLTDNNAAWIGLGELCRQFVIWNIFGTKETNNLICLEENVG